MKQKIANYFELAARWYVFFFLNLYGIGKILGGQFYRKGNLPAEVANTTLANAEAFDIAWTFMGYSQAYILFVGISQIIGAWCLLFNRTKLIGVIILVPILLNIIVFDLIFLDMLGALASASIYFTLLLTILYFHRSNVIEVFKILTKRKEKNATSFAEILKTTLIAGGIMILIFFLDQFLVNFFGHGKG